MWTALYSFDIFTFDCHVNSWSRLLMCEFSDSLDKLKAFQYMQGISHAISSRAFKKTVKTNRLLTTGAHQNRKGPSTTQPIAIYTNFHLL